MSMTRLCLTIVAIMHVIPAAGAVQPPEPRPVEEIRSVLARAPALPDAAGMRKLSIILVADKKDHGANEHDYPLWQKRWNILFGGKLEGDPETQVNLYGPSRSAIGDEASGGSPKVKVIQALQWPNGEQWKTADLVVVFCYIAWDEQKFKDLETFLASGGGFVMIHSATWTKPSPSSRLAAITGIGGFTKWRHGALNLKINTGHAICLGLPEQLTFLDEPYWPPSPAIYPGQIHVLATSDEKTTKDSEDTVSQPMFWLRQHGRGRVFCCVPGHYTWTFDDPYFRLLLLRGMAWAAGETPYRFDPLVLRGARITP